MKPVIVKITKTCTACPSQWEAYTDIGQYVYFRYRNGNLKAVLCDNEEDYFDQPDKNIMIFREKVGHDYAGYMEYEELKSRLREFFVFPEKEENSTEEN